MKKLLLTPCAASKPLSCCSQSRSSANHPHAEPQRGLEAVAGVEGTRVSVPRGGESLSERTGPVSPALRAWLELWLLVFPGKEQLQTNWCVARRRS